jgi:signal transduction histidine kinase
MDLRSTPDEGDDIVRGLSEFGASLERDFGAKFNVVLHESPKALDPIARPAIYCIGREAIFNAYRHGSPKEVVLELTYGRDSFALSITDDGDGIPNRVLLAGGKDGHWGMAGMKERAKALGGSIKIGNHEPKGTEVVFDLPSRRAYMVPSGFSLRHWLRSLAGKI